MTNKLDQRDYSAHDIFHPEKKLLEGIQSGIPHTRVASLTENGGPTLAYRNGFKTDAAFMITHEGKHRALFIGHFKQGGGYRILIESANDGNEPTHAIHIRSGDERTPQRWEVQRGIAKRNKKLESLIGKYDAKELLNKPDTSPRHQMEAVAAVIIHAVAPEYALGDLPSRVAARFLPDTPVRPAATAQTAHLEKPSN